MENQPSDIERKLVTIISADVAEYSRLMAENEEETLRVFREHKVIFEQLVKLHRGRVFNTAGDAILAEFNSAVEGVRCATEIQSALRTRNDKLPKNRQVRFRIGVNLGDVILQGNDLLGDGVNIAARLQAAAEPGGVCISGSVYDQIQNKLSLGVDNMGERTFKNIPHAVRTFSIRETEAHEALPTAYTAKQASKQFAGIYAVSLAAGMAVLVFVFGAYLVFRGVAGDSKNKPVSTTLMENGQKKEVALVPQPVKLPGKFERKYLNFEGKIANTTVEKSIAEALAKALPGEVIDIKPGVYNEHLKIEKDVVLRGMAADDGTIGVKIDFSGSETIDVVSGKVRLENMIVALSPTNDNGPAAILLRGGSLELKNTIAYSASGSAASGLSIRDGEAHVENSEFTGVRGIEQLGGKLICNGCEANDNAEEGVVVMNQSGSPGFSSEFKNFVANGNGMQAFAVMDKAFVTVTGCKIQGSHVNGVFVNGTGHLVMKDCEVSKSKENGVVATDNAKVEISGSRLSENGYSGYVSLGQAVVTIRKSELQGNGEFGYALTENSTIAADEANKIAGNRNGSIYRAPASTVPLPEKK